jgi:hypothetical protein
MLGTYGKCILRRPRRKSRNVSLSFNSSLGLCAVLIKDIVKGADYTKLACAAFIAACRVGDDFVEKKLKDSDAVFKRLPWLLEWNQNLTQQAVIAVREKGKLKPKLRREIKPVTQIVSSTYCASY